jgi:hypothetical protein
MNQLVADYFQAWINPDVEQRKLGGALDRGDISGVKVHGQRVVVEVKNTAKIDASGFLREAEIERVNDGALAGVVAYKRHGKGKPGDQVVMMTMRDFVAIITGVRPNDEEMETASE